MGVFRMWSPDVVSKSGHSAWSWPILWFDLVSQPTICLFSPFFGAFLGAVSTSNLTLQWFNASGGLFA